MDQIPEAIIAGFPGSLMVGVNNGHCKLHAAPWVKEWLEAWWVECVDDLHRDQKVFQIVAFDNLD